LPSRPLTRTGAAACPTANYGTDTDWGAADWGAADWGAADWVADWQDYLYAFALRPLTDCGIVGRSLLRNLEGRPSDAEIEALIASADVYLLL